MPREDQHRAKAERNEQFADQLDLSDVVQENWAVVAAFYAALHYTEQFFVAADGTSCYGHEERNNRFKSDFRIRAAYPSFEFLYSLSKKARYHCDPLPLSVYQKQAKPRLAAVKRQMDFAIQKLRQ
ncbi:MAG: hypothetical protein ABSE42_06635 [Bryobacteraceae bacterium]|jgi:hypothetical protein